MESRKKTVLFGAILALTALTGQSILGMWENEKESPTTPTKGPVVSFDQFLETPTKPKPKMLDEKEEEKLPELSRKNYFRQLRWSFAPFQSTENERIGLHTEESLSNNQEVPVSSDVSTRG